MPHVICGQVSLARLHLASSSSVSILTVTIFTVTFSQWDCIVMSAIFAHGHWSNSWPASEFWEKFWHSEVFGERLRCRIPPPVWPGFFSSSLLSLSFLLTCTCISTVCGKLFHLLIEKCLEWRKLPSWWQSKFTSKRKIPLLRVYWFSPLSHSSAVDSDEMMLQPSPFVVLLCHKWSWVVILVAFLLPSLLHVFKWKCQVKHVKLL